MSKVVKRRHYSIAGIILTLSVGSAFVALGITMFVMFTASIIGESVDISVIVPYLFVLLLLAFGGAALYFGGKDTYHLIREHRAKKYGREGTAKIFTHSSKRAGKNSNGRLWSFTLSYQDGGEYKKFKTDYVFDVNEYRYLLSLPEVAIKIDGNFVAIDEQFTDELYKIHSRFGIEMAFFKQKPVRICLILFGVFFFLALAYLITAIVLSTTIGLDIGVLLSIVLLFSIPTPFMIVLAIYLIQWIWFRNK